MKALAATLLVTAFSVPLAAAQAKTDRDAHRIALFVDDFGTDPGAATVREKIIAAILSRANVKIVASRKDAKVILAGSATTSPVVRFGVHMEDLNGNIAWAFDESKCGGLLGKPIPGTPMWEAEQRYGDTALFGCLGKQFAQAVGKK